MKEVFYIMIVLACATSVLAEEPPPLSVSTNLMAPPEYRSYQLKKTYKRGGNAILEDIWYGRRKNEAKRMQHVMHNGAIVYTVRESGHGLTKYFKSNAVSIQEHDINGDGKTDLLFLMPLGTAEVIEAFLVTGGKFLSPLPSEDRFDKNGERRSYADVISTIRDRVSEERDALGTAPEE